MTTQNVSRCCVDVFFGAQSPLPDSTVLGNTHWHIFGIGMVILILAVELFWSKGAKEPAEAGSEEGAAALLTSSCAADPQPCQQWLLLLPLSCCLSGCFLQGLWKHSLQGKVKPHVTQMLSFLAQVPARLWAGREGAGSWACLWVEYKHREGPSPQYQQFWEERVKRGSFGQLYISLFCFILQGVKLQSVNPMRLKIDSTASHV